MSPTPSSLGFSLQAQKTAAEDVMPVLAGAVDPVHALPMLVQTLAAEEHPRVLAPMKMISLVSPPLCVCGCGCGCGWVWVRVHPLLTVVVYLNTYRPAGDPSSHLPCHATGACFQVVMYYMCTHTKWDFTK